MTEPQAATQSAGLLNDAEKAEIEAAARLMLEAMTRLVVVYAQAIARTVGCPAAE